MANETKMYLEAIKLPYGQLFVGCEGHQCTYCLSPETLILMADLLWKPIKDIEVGDYIVGFDEFSPEKGIRKLKKSTVLNKINRRAEVYEIVTDKGKVKCSSLHTWLCGHRWRLTKNLNMGDEIKYLSKPTQFKFEEDHDHKYIWGYLAGGIEGDGCIRKKESHSTFRLAVRDEEFLATVYAFLLQEEVSCRLRMVNLGKNGDCLAVSAYTTSEVEKIENLIKFDNTNSFLRGYLAGMFDAEGSYSPSNLRFSNTDKEILEKIIFCLENLGFKMKHEKREAHCDTIRIYGGIPKIIEFFSTTNPRIIRKKENIFNLGFRTKSAIIKSIKPVGIELTYDLTTSTSTFIANGFASHNCGPSFQAQMRRQKHNCLKCYHFEPHWHEERYQKYLKKMPKTNEGEFIWLCRAGDLTCAKEEWMHKMIHLANIWSDRTFFFQTKDPKCYEKYDFPDNTIIGITLESNIDKGYPEISKAPLPTQRYHDFLNIDHKRKTITIEPILQFNFDPFVEMIKNINPEWVWVGYDSRNTGLPEPSLIDTHTLIKTLQTFTKVKTKLLREKMKLPKYRGILEYC